MKRIAMVHPSHNVGDLSIAGMRYYRAFFEELGRLGCIEGQNLAVECYSGEGRTERYAELVRDIVGSQPDLIFSISGGLASRFKMATTTIPIVTIAPIRFS